MAAVFHLPRYPLGMDMGIVNPVALVLWRRDIPSDKGNGVEDVVLNRERPDAAERLRELSWKNANTRKAEAVKQDMCGVKNWW